jgi:hypothetical protein
MSEHIHDREFQMAILKKTKANGWTPEDWMFFWIMVAGIGWIGFVAMGLLLNSLLNVLKEPQRRGGAERNFEGSGVEANRAVSPRITGEGRGEETCTANNDSGRIGDRAGELRAGPGFAPEFRSRSGVRPVFSLIPAGGWRSSPGTSDQPVVSQESKNFPAAWMAAGRRDAGMEQGAVAQGWAAAPFGAGENQPRINTETHG